MLVTSKTIRERRREVLIESRESHLSQEETGRRLLEIDPEYAPGWLALGTAKLSAGDLDAAEPLLWGAVERAPSNPGYYFPLMALCRERGDTGGAAAIAALAMWKVSFYDEIPESIAETLRAQIPSVGDAASDPQTYALLAETTQAEIGEQPWPERLTAYRLLNEVQRQAGVGLEPELLGEIRAHAAVCAPIFRAALREAYDTSLSSLSVEAESLLMALLGEIGGVEAIDDLLDPPVDGPEEMFHSQWAVWRLGQRFPEEAFARLRAAGAGPDPDLRATIAQQLYFLPETSGARPAILGLLDGFPSFAADEGAPYLLLTVSTLLALMGAARDSLAAIKRHERQLSKDGRRWMNEAIEGFVPDLIDFGIDKLDVEAVCVTLALMPDDDEDDEEEFEEPAPKVKPGRNDPCWCGSGKKYKKCHLQADEEEERRDLDRDAESELFGAAWRQLVDFSKKFHRRSDMEHAYRLFFDREIGEVDPEGFAESGFVLWYVLDFRASPGARTVIEEFLRRPGARLTDQAQALIESWRANRHALWEVQSIAEGRGAEVRDVFEGGTRFVDDVTTSREAHRWDCMISRVHRFEGRWLFLGDGMLVPRPLVAEIREQVAAGARESGMTEAEFFRSRSHEWRRFVLDSHEDRMKGLRLVNFEGDPLEFSSAEYEVVDAEAAAAALPGAIFEETTTGDDGPDKRTFGWLAEAEGDGPRRSYGHVEIAGGRLRLECNSRKRLGVGRDLVEERCGAAVRHLKDSFKTIDEARQEVGEAPPEAKRLDPALEREIVLKYQAEHYAKWVDEHLPALGGRTPREAVESAEGREAVESLLRDFENGSDRARKAGRPAFDFSGVRATLGL